ncbi:MAG: response regulator [Bdellovibrionota bacterium]|nr:response regulator [Bdellovibrionota bacterium]
MADESKSKGKILIVDDSADIRLLLILKLKKAGYEVLAASNGMEALEMVGENKDIKLIILDVMMPVMNGIQTMKLLLNRIEKNQTNKDEEQTEEEGEEPVSTEVPEAENLPLLKVVFCTAKQDPRQIELALQAGADDYITKPIDETIMVQKINRLMGQNENQMFAILRTQLEITIEEYPKEKPALMSEISEVSCKFECGYHIPDASVVTIHSPKLEGYFKRPVLLKGAVVFQEKKGPDLFETDIFFKGLTEDDRKELRSVTTTKRELKEEEEEEEGEEGEEGEKEEE